MFLADFFMMADILT